MLEYNSQNLYLNNLFLVEQEVNSVEQEIQESTVNIHTTLSSTGCSFRGKGISFSFFTNHPNYSDIKLHAIQSLTTGILEKDTYDYLLNLTKLVWKSRDLTINTDDSYFFGYKIPNNLHTILLTLDHTDTTLMRSWHLFLERLFNTPYLEVFTNIGDYISKYNIELDLKGFLKLKKVVNNNNSDVHSGNILFNSKGRVKIPRFNLNPNPVSEDPFGIHAYPLCPEVSEGLKVIDVLVPADFIVRVPANNSKLMVYSLFVG